MRGTADANDRHNPEVRRIFTSNGLYDPLNPNYPANTPPVRTFQIIDLEPYKFYDVQVIVENSVGKAASPWVTQQTSASGKYRLTCKHAACCIDPILAQFWCRVPIYISFNVYITFEYIFHHFIHNYSIYWYIYIYSHLPSNLWYKPHLIRQYYYCWSLKCSRSIACHHWSNYIFIIDLIGFNGLCEDNYKTRQKKFCNLVWLILEVWH